MKRLKRIRLINWHRLTLHTFEMDGHLLLMGDNGSGKSTILDALQVGLVGNMRAVRLNLAANEGGDRSLKSYVLGVVGGGSNGQTHRALRKNATAYILLEFQDEETKDSLVLGTVIDAHADGRSPEKEHFIAEDSCFEDCPCLTQKQVPRSVKEFKREIQQQKNIKRYPRVEEYQQAVLKQLGGLDAEFFRLFVSGMAFRKIRHLRDFVYDFLLPEAAEVQVVSLREAAERYRQLHELSKEAQERIDLLDQIGANAQTAKVGQEEADQLRALIDRAKLAECETKLTDANTQDANCQAELADAKIQHAKCEDLSRQARETLTRLQQDMAAHEQHHAALSMENHIDRLTDEIRHENRQSERLRHALESSRSALSLWRELMTQSLPGSEMQTDAAPKAFQYELHEAFGAEVVNRLNAFDALAADCLAGKLPPAEERNFVRRAADDWPAFVHWLQSRQFQLDSHISELRVRERAQAEELRELVHGHRLLPPGVIQFQDALHEVGISSSVFCELIEVSDATRQDIIEAVLGSRRYDVFVPPEQLADAIGIYQAIKDSDRVSMGLVNTKQLSSVATLAAPNSLAQLIETTHGLARKYADAILGQVFTIENLNGEFALHVADESKHLTADGLLIGEFAIRRIPRDVGNQHWQIGGGGLSARRETLEDTLQTLREGIRQAADLHDQIQNVHDHFDRGRRGPELLAEDYELFARLQDLRQQYLQAREELEALKDSDIGEMRQRVEIAEQKELDSGKDLKHAWGRQCVAEEALKSSESRLARATAQCAEAKTNYEECWYSNLEVAEHCEQQVSSLGPKPDWEEWVSKWSEKLATLQKSFGRGHDDGVRLKTEYNNRFQFAGDCLSDDIQIYLDERDRWVDSELPGYGSRLETARETARQALEEEVIHRLRERLRQVERQFHELNQALDGLNFSGRRYRFTHAVRQEFQRFYEMVLAAESVGDQMLHQSEWHERFSNGPLEELLEDVLSGGGNRALKELERCTDYRAYFEYDIEITEADGTRHAFSHVAASGSGGETQTPYYVAMLASLARIYRTQTGSGSRAALVAFDEPFQKMDESNIAATLSLAHRLGLQVLLAAPKDRCHQLLPAMGTATCLLVLRDGNRVMLEPFQRIAEVGDNNAGSFLDTDTRLTLPTTPKTVK